MDVLMHIVVITLAVAMILATARLARGPSLPNRVVALDVLAILGAALTATLAIQFDKAVFLDVTIVLALISFLGTVAFAYYVEKRAR